MTASVFDSPMFTKLYPVGEVGRLFTHSAEIRAALLVLGTLAKVQTERGDIPEDSAFFIHRSSMEVQIDPAGLADGVANDGSYIPALVAAFDKAMEAPEHSKYIMHNSNPQDVADTALMLRLRQLLTQAETALKALPDSDSRTMANWLTLAGDTAANTASTSPANAALRAQLLGLNTLFQETSDAASEALYLPQIALSSLSMLHMASAA